ncbi:hypothetical protein [Salibacterium aidingense]|uniref:hypothetical protein n=1 Tax=Salibacterium aidingense TaxID=384933 RepID=UPI0012EC6224|nr:hypothetical protein [Salibacterium aidingense]
MFPLHSSDWGEANRNPMVRAFGRKRGARAKCQSCAFCITKNGILTCAYRYPVEHSSKHIACRKYRNRHNEGMVRHE